MKKSGNEKNLYIPSRGDIVGLDFNSRMGRKEVGQGLAIVISPKEFNGLSSLVFLCPITSKVKGFSFEVPLTTETKTEGVVLIHHLRSVDWRARNIKFIEQAPASVINEICAKLKPLIFVT